MVDIPLIETVVSLVITALTVGGLPALFLLMVVESFGIPPLPSEVILPFAGFLIALGSFSWPGAIAAAVGGQLVGSFIAYAVGRWGRAWLTRPGAGGLRLDPKHLAAMDRWFARRGEPTVLVARLLPVVRSYISYPAGGARMEPTRFGAYTLLGVIPFTTALLYAGFVLRSHWDAIVPYFRIADYAAIAVIAVGFVYVLLRWRGYVSAGWPPRFTRSTGSPRPVEAATPSAMDPGSRAP